MKKITFLSVIFLVIIWTLSSCSTTKFLPEDVSARAKNLTLTNGKVIIYVFQRKSIGKLLFEIYCNNNKLTSFDHSEIGHDPGKQFYLCILDPGRYLFTGRSIKFSWPDHNRKVVNENELIVNLEANKKYYIEAIQTTELLATGIKIEQVDPIDGNSIVQKCKLIGMNTDARDLLGYR